VAGLGLKLLVPLQAGKGEPVPVTLQVKLTGELYPLMESSVTVEVPDEPGLTAAGVVAVTEKSAVLGTEYLAIKASGKGVLKLQEVQLVW
jgi:hypothetical protein